MLRNIINSSCDQPIGYPIYVSPLMTSFAETHPQILATLGEPLSVSAIRRVVLRFFRRLQARCGEGCSSGGSAAQCDVEISLENINSNLVLPPGILTGRGGYTPANMTSSAATLGTYSTLSAPPGMASFAFTGTFQSNLTSNDIFIYILNCRSRI